ncbi:hypothetical protein GCM10009654_61180 [Streptomyces hebeiensis]|uniref:Helicase-associated domain-containing protein n=1 Tax=Streptomyces hebeiensis TaxID=229486 RepID=A0ABN1V5M9_9ACTN
MWLQGCQALLRWRAENQIAGVYAVPYDVETEVGAIKSFPLGRWVHQQRKALRAGEPEKRAPACRAGRPSAFPPRPGRADRGTNGATSRSARRRRVRRTGCFSRVVPTAVSAAPTAAAANGTSAPPWIEGRFPYRRATRGPCGLGAVGNRGAARDAVRDDAVHGPCGHPVAAVEPAPAGRAGCTRPFTYARSSPPARSEPEGGRWMPCSTACECLLISVDPPGI